MVPCPWLTEVADYAKSHPDADLGLHLTLTSEWKTYRWGSVAPSDKVPSLLDPVGTFYSTTEEAAAHAKPAEAELEMRAQVERALAIGIHPTHLDSHMGTALRHAGAVRRLRQGRARIPPPVPRREGRRRACQVAFAPLAARRIFDNVVIATPNVAARTMARASTWTRQEPQARTHLLDRASRPTTTPRCAP